MESQSNHISSVDEFIRETLGFSRPHVIAVLSTVDSEVDPAPRLLFHRISHTLPVVTCDDFALIVKYYRQGHRQLLYHSPCCHDDRS